MTHRRLSPLLVVALLLAGFLPAPPPALAKEATTFRLVARYSENGPGAGTDGITTAMFLSSAGGGVAIARIQSSLGPLLAPALSALQAWQQAQQGGAASVAPPAAGGSAEPQSMSSIANLMNQSVPIDLASLLPLDAHYEARLDCTMEEQPDGTFSLRDGKVTWTVRNSGQFEYDGGYMVDRFGGAGSEALDPETDNVTMTVDRSGDSYSYTLTVDVDHKQPTSGESTWSALGGAFVLNVRLANGVETMSGQSMGEEIPPETRVREDERGFYYTHTGPLSEFKYNETYRNLLDAQVLMDYQVFPECEADVLEPERNGRLTMMDCAGCGHNGMLRAQTSPEVWVDHLRWKMPEFAGQDPLYSTDDPFEDEPLGGEVEYTYTGPGPEDNAEFGPAEIQLTFESEASTCEPPPPHPVRFFFPRDGRNSPDSSLPNWFYYWRQTAAGQGHEGAIVYDPNSGADDAYGYYNGWVDPSQAEVIYIGPLFDLAGGSTYENPVTGRRFEGIDFFATIVLHEWTHLENYHDWWGETGYNDTVDFVDGKAVWHPDPADRDGDLMPDSVEASYGLIAGKKDTFGIAKKDSEYPPYLQMDTWAVGSANRHDWADPGKQSGS